MLFGVLDQHCSKLLGIRAIIGQDRYQAGPIGQCEAHRVRMTDFDGLVDTSSCRLYCLVGKPLQPKRSRQHNERSDPLIRAVLNGVQVTIRRNRRIDGAKRAGTRARLISEVMQRQCHHAISHREVSLGGMSPSNALKLLRQLQRCAIFADQNLVQPNPVKCPQLVLGMVSLTGPRVYIIDMPSAARSSISVRGSWAALQSSAAKAFSTRAKHSPSSDNCIHKGTQAAVSATLIALSPPGEEVHSRAVRTLSMSSP